MMQKFFTATVVALCLVLAVGVVALARGDAEVSVHPSDTRTESATGESAAETSAHALTISGKREIREQALMRNRASTLVGLARVATDSSKAMLYLRQALALDLSRDEPRSRKILYTIHGMLADLYAETPGKRAHHLAQAAELVSDENSRALILDVVEGLGGDPYAGDSPAKTVGEHDTCDEGKVADPMTAIGDLYTDNLTVEPDGDREWYDVTIDTGDPAVGLALRIETFTDGPIPPVGGGKDDDTWLWLYGECDPATGDFGGGVDLIDFDDDSGEGFMSLIQTDCLRPGTYYLMVGGHDEEEGADNIDLEIEATGSCTFILSDEFEVDDDRDTAKGIDPSGESQDRSIYPEGDVDTTSVSLDDTRLLRITTDEDTDLSLLYSSNNVPVDGLCNQTASAGDPPGVIDQSLSNGCNTDDDCPEFDDLLNPFPGLPRCLTWNFFPPNQRPIDTVDNPLADDSDGFGGDITVCLPKTAMPSPSPSVDGDPAQPFSWYTQVASHAGFAEFNYNMTIEDLGPCTWEVEDNDDPATTASMLTLGEPTYGIFDYSARGAKGDHDYHKFDVAEITSVRIETNAYNPMNVDTLLELWVGPDAAGEFALLDSNDDRNPEMPGDLTSQIEAVLPPACDHPSMVGACDGMGGGGADAAYYAGVTAPFVTGNFPYSVEASAPDDLFGEVTDFGDCNLEPSYDAGPNTRGIAAIEFSCDFDAYVLSLEEDANFTIRTTNAIDTIMEIRDCSSGEILACDDDGNGGASCPTPYCSQVSGCLAGGRDYCIRVRAWSSASIFDYNIEFIDNGGECEPTEPPTVDGTGGTSCSAGFDTFAGCEQEDPAICAEPPLYVVLDTFTAQHAKDGILVQWTTAFERDNAGFRLLRETEGKEKVLETLTPVMISARGDQLNGASYQFLDEDKLVPGTVNYYLEDIDFNGEVTRHGPISVTIVDPSLRKQPSGIRTVKN